MHVFLNMLDGTLHERFLECDISTENTIFIATANSTDNIPEHILNRFDAIIHLEAYSEDDKVEIAKRHIVPKVLEFNNILPGNVVFEEEAIRCIITRYCEDSGARDLKHGIKKVVDRLIGLGMVDSKTTVTRDFVIEVLDELVDDTPGLIFNRNREAYPEEVSEEIERCCSELKKNASESSEIAEKRKLRERLDILLACRKELETFFDSFNPEAFADKLHETIYGMNNVIKEVTNFYYTSFLQGENVSSNLLLHGGYGVGKTTIAKAIADALGYKFIKISLNGIDDVRDLLGFSSTYKDSRVGRIMKEIRDAGTTRVVLFFDELDKVSKSEIKNAILDIVDRKFTDSYLGVPVDLSQMIIIAAANELDTIPVVLRDRFIVCNVDGYSREEKSQIVSDYIIPKLERSYEAKDVSIEIEEDAKQYLLKTYANSFGVRDAEKAINRICSGKLVDQADREDSMQVVIQKNDISRYLGPEPIPRGNFPDYESPVSGVSRALAVSNRNWGSSFAIETVLIDGEETLEMTGLPKESATDSVKIALTCVRKMYPGLLKGKQVHVHFGEGSVPKDGPSAGVALFMSILSAALDRPLMDKKPYDIAYTGEISLSGGIFAVGGCYEKIQAASDAGCSKVFIPLQSYERLEEEKLKQFDCKVIPVSHISQVITEVFPEV